MDRIDIHKKATRSVMYQLRRKGHKVQKVSPNFSGYDLLVDGVCKVSIRGSRERKFLHTVTTLGRTYSYYYRISNFNFHQHGQMPTEPHIFCCSTQRKNGRITFIIPREEVAGKVFSLHWSVRNHPYSGQYAGFINRWEIIKWKVRSIRDFERKTVKRAA